LSIWSTVGHAQNASAGVLQVGANLVLELLAVDRGTTATSASRVTALDHEVRNDAVEDGAIVVVARGEGREVLAGLKSNKIVSY
jgi:hypothetical protein